MIKPIFIEKTSRQIHEDFWDADRTRMAWHYGFEDSFFNTSRGKYATQHWLKYLEFQKLCFPKMTWSKQY